METSRKVRTPLFPLYSEVRQLLKIWQGVAKTVVYDMIKAIQNQTGTPQNPVDWSEPDRWIPARLSGSDTRLAATIWHQSQQTVNPRHVYGSYLFISTYNLLVAGPDDMYQLTKQGEGFLNQDPPIVRDIDEAEGIPQLLAILATKTQAKRADLLTEWGDFLHEYSNFGTPSTIKDTLRRRLGNAIERGLVERQGNIYLITSQGVQYAARISRQPIDPQRNVLQAINTYNQKQRETLKAQLSEMHPYRFEHLVRDLLEAMGYEDVTVTKESGDKGVDVVATVQFGISTIKEVIQVKRHKGNIGRPILDQLRGALPYHKAIRGTIITLGKFSGGCQEAALFAGAAPIGLIDGEKLLDLLIEHEVGIRKRPAQLYEIDEGVFTTVGETAEELEMISEN